MKCATFTHDSESGWSDLGAARSADLVVLFGCSSLLDHPEVIEDLKTAIPDAILIGCSTAGEILGTDIRDGCGVAAAIEFDSTSLRYAAAPITATTSYDAGQELALALDEADLAAVFVLSAGLDVNGSELVRGTSDRLKEDVIITGGLAGDGDRFERTWVIADGQPTPGMVAAVGFYGDRIRVGHGSQGGWDMFGPERLITRSEGNVVYEIDGRPALSLYKEYLGELASGLPATGLLFPLSVRRPEESDELVRTILAVDEEAQSLVFAGDVPTGSYGTLMQANFDRLVEGAEDAARLAATPAGTGSVLSIAISCVGRRLVLGSRVEEEVEATLDVLPAGTTQIGFYSYGEISPHTNGTCELHNQTMTLTTIAEDW
jgi:hypothetical protein